MKTFASRSRALCALTSILLGSAPGVIAAEVVLHKVPALTVEQAPAYPENLARHHLGAQVEVTPHANATGEQKAAESTLLSGDPAASYGLPAGTTTMLVSLAKIENVESISFLNKGAKGQVTIATSNAKLAADSPQWHSALTQEISDAVQAKVGPMEAKYVRLTFNVSEPGRIASLGIYSSPQVSDFTAPRSRKMASSKNGGSYGLVSYNYTDIHAKARALYVSSGSDVKQANNMIDDQPATAYSFAAEDGSPTTVIDLGERRTLRRLSAVYAPRAGSMQFYVLQSLPSVQASDVADNAPDTVRMDDATFASMSPIGSATDDGSQGRASVDFPETAGRYVMVRWTAATQQDSPFTLAEIAAIGGADANRTLLAQNIETASAETESADTAASDGKTMLDGKTMIDAKDMPGEGPAEEAPQSPGEGPPPSLPQPPPFTFVPVLVPASP